MTSRTSPATLPDAVQATGRPRRRQLAVVGLVLTLAATTIGYVLVERDRVLAQAAAAPTATRAELTTVLAVPHVVFRSTALDPSYGKVSVVGLDDPTGPRAVTEVDCDRVYSVAERYLCLSSDQGITTSYAATLLGQDLRPTGTLPLAGLPSRARLSPDARFSTTTAFVSGHSYVGAGFSTQTLVTDDLRGVTTDLEGFTLRVDGRVRDEPDRNVWGVTFADEDTFYATAASAGRTWLVKGTLRGRSLTALREDAECPSLSPDRSTLVYKKRGTRPPGQWRLAAYDLTKGTERVLAGNRSVDDQAEWLDDAHVLYGLPRAGSEAAVTDVWSVRVDGIGVPELLIPQAWSPSVVRTPGPGRVVAPT